MLHDVTWCYLMLHDVTCSMIFVDFVDWSRMVVLCWCLFVVHFILKISHCILTWCRQVVPAKATASPGWLWSSRLSRRRSGLDPADIGRAMLPGTSRVFHAKSSWKCMEMHGNAGIGPRFSIFKGQIESDANISMLHADLMAFLALFTAGCQSPSATLTA